MQQFLIMYYTTPLTTTGTSPAQILFSHTPNNGLPIIKPSKTIAVKNHETNYREQNKKHIEEKRFTQRKEHQVGEKVLVKRPKANS